MNRGKVQFILLGLALLLLLVGCAGGPFCPGPFARRGHLSSPLEGTTMWVMQ